MYVQNFADNDTYCQGNIVYSEQIAQYPTVCTLHNSSMDYYNRVDDDEAWKDGQNMYIIASFSTFTVLGHLLLYSQTPWLRYNTPGYVSGVVPTSEGNNDQLLCYSNDFMSYTWIANNYCHGKYIYHCINETISYDYYENYNCSGTGIIYTEVKPYRVCENSGYYYNTDMCTSGTVTPAYPTPHPVNSPTYHPTVQMSVTPGYFIQEYYSNASNTNTNNTYGDICISKDVIAAVGYYIGICMMNYGGIGTSSMFGYDSVTINTNTTQYNIYENWYFNTMDCSGDVINLYQGYVTNVCETSYDSFLSSYSNYHTMGYFVPTANTKYTYKGISYNYTNTIIYIYIKYILCLLCILCIYRLL